MDCYRDDYYTFISICMQTKQNNILKYIFFKINTEYYLHLMILKLHLYHQPD